MTGRARNKIRNKKSDILVPRLVKLSAELWARIEGAKDRLGVKSRTGALRRLVELGLERLEKGR